MRTIHTVKLPFAVSIAELPMYAQSKVVGCLVGVDRVTDNPSDPFSSVNWVPYAMVYIEVDTARPLVHMRLAVVKPGDTIPGDYSKAESFGAYGLDNVAIIYNIGDMDLPIGYTVPESAGLPAPTKTPKKLGAK